MAETIGASTLLAALARKHAGDVFVPECKDGPTHTRSHRRMDAWVLVKTWSPITTIGYEVKVSRSDWRRDEKLGDYFPLCHLLYIVAPKGIVPTDELPDGVGLLELAGHGDGARLVTRRKAARREVTLPAELMVYVLMCRAQITREREPIQTGDGLAREWTVRELRQWVEGKDARRKLSDAVSQKIRAAFDEQERNVRDMQRRCEELEAVRDRIVELGFSPDESFYAWRVNKRLADIAGIVSPSLLTDLERAEQQVRRAREALAAFAPQRPATVAV